MTHPPGDGATPLPPQGPGPWTPPAGEAFPPAGEQAAPAGRSRRTPIVIAAVAGGAILVGGTGYAVASFLSGGGAQPEEVLPGDTIAFVKVDLDPSAGQKMAVASLLEKFPALGDGTEGLRQELVDSLLQDSGADLTYAEDVEPWLGDRMAAAAVPDEGSEMGVAPVVVLAVDDEQAATDTLERVRDDLGFGFAVRDGFVLIAQTQDTADRLAQQEGSLADDADYAGDRDALGGDQVAVAWADLSAAQALFEQAAAAAGGPVGQELSGRLVVGLHAEETALELEGLVFDVSDVPVSDGEPTRLVSGLPADTLAALGVSEAGENAVRVWDEMVASGALPPGVEQQAAELGLTLPDDLRTVLGTDLAVAVGGNLQAPAVGARVATDDPQGAIGIVEQLAALGGPELPLVTAPADGGYVVATDPGLADALGGDGGLGDSETFRAAVPEPDDATVVGFVDLGAILDQVPDPGTEEGLQPSDLEALDALGFSASGTDEGGRFVLRVTTR